MNTHAGFLVDAWFYCMGAVSDADRIRLGLESAARMPRSYLRLVDQLAKVRRMPVYSIDDLVLSDQQKEYAAALGHLLDSFGSDKARLGYHPLYALIFDLLKPKRILEIGLGTTNVNIPSNMGHHGAPGASLRAFKAFSPNSRILGADIDPNISIEGFNTFVVDQVQPDTFVDLTRRSGSAFDLIIDDGLHSVEANLNTLTWAICNLTPNGVIAIEDINENSLDIWFSLYPLLLSSGYSASLVFSGVGYICVIGRDDVLSSTYCTLSCA
jgi:hypothetical protein